MRVIMTSNYSKSKRGKNNTSAGRVVKKAKTNNNAKTTKPKALENKHKKTILRVLEEKGIQYCFDKCHSVFTRASQGLLLRWI